MAAEQWKNALGCSRTHGPGQEERGGRKGPKGKVLSQSSEKHLSHDPWSGSLSRGVWDRNIGKHRSEADLGSHALDGTSFQKIAITACVPALVWGGQLPLIWPAGQSLVIASGWVSMTINRILACNQTPQHSVRVIKFFGLNCPYEVSQLLIILWLE